MLGAFCTAVDRGKDSPLLLNVQQRLCSLSVGRRGTAGGPKMRRGGACVEHNFPQACKVRHVCVLLRQSERRLPHL